MTEASTDARWTLKQQDTDHSRACLVFSCSGPATFTLTVDDKGNAELFGYDVGLTADAPALDEYVEPVLVFDTDGSDWLDPKLGERS